MPIKKIKTLNAPAAIGPYSQAIQQGNWLFLSGQIPLHPETGEVVGQDISVQTEQVLKNLMAVLTAAGANLSHVLQTSVYLTDLTDFSQFNQVYSQFFNPPYPARSTVQVAALPKGVRIEIAAIAVRE
ncbi:MAG: RidA family protein [Candidatus Schekmanbacteria bacterium]|nr:RidA family protein [Candidatus Schekmanbacteria bacterium]